MRSNLFAMAAHVLGRKTGIHLSRVIARPVADNPVPASQPAIRCAVLTQGQLKRWCRDAELELSKDQVRAASGRGELCVGAFRDGRLVGYQWLAFSEAPTLPVCG